VAATFSRRKNPLAHVQITCAGASVCPLLPLSPSARARTSFEHEPNLFRFYFTLLLIRGKS